MANHIYVISQNDSSKLKIFVVVNKIQINIAYARYKIHHTHTQHTLNQHPVESRASHKNNACFEELVHSKHNFNWYKVVQVKRVEIMHTRTFLLPLKRTSLKRLADLLSTAQNFMQNNQWKCRYPGQWQRPMGTTLQYFTYIIIIVIYFFLLITSKLLRWGLAK